MQQIITKSAAIRGKRNISAALCRRGFCAWQLVASLFLRRHPDGRDVRNGKEIENKGKLRDRKRGTDGSANANKLNVMGRSDRTVVSLSWSYGSRRANPLHATNWLKYLRNWHDNRITWLCTVVARDPDAHPLVPSSAPSASSLHSSVSSAAHLHLPYKRQIRVIKRPLAGHMHCSRWPCNFRLEDLPASMTLCPAPLFPPPLASPRL